MGVLSDSSYFETMGKMNGEEAKSGWVLIIESSERKLEQEYRYIEDLGPSLEGVIFSISCCQWAYKTTHDYACGFGF